MPPLRSAADSRFDPIPLALSWHAPAAANCRTALSDCLPSTCRLPAYPCRNKSRNAFLALSTSHHGSSTYARRQHKSRAQDRQPPAGTGTRRAQAHPLAGSRHARRQHLHGPSIGEGSPPPDGGRAPTTSTQPRSLHSPRSSQRSHDVPREPRLLRSSPLARSPPGRSSVSSSATHSPRLSSLSASSPRSSATCSTSGRSV